MSRDEAVHEVLTLLTGTSPHYYPESDRYSTVVMALNRALRQNATEHEWSYYSDVEDIGNASYGHQTMHLRSSLRARLINDDAIRLADCDGNIKAWAYSLPRDALHKYAYSPGLWYSVTRTTVEFSRPFTQAEDGMRVLIPVMREPRLYVPGEYGGSGESGGPSPEIPPVG